MLIIANILNKSVAILHSDGLKVYEDLVTLYNEVGEIVVSFEGLEHCATAFLNASIGKLLMNLPDAEEVIKNRLRFVGVKEGSPLERKIQDVIELALNAPKRAQLEDSVRDHLYA